MSNLAVVVALVFATAGGSFAATGAERRDGPAGAAGHKSKYLITSVTQIKPGVLARLKGERGLQGEKGQTGSSGTKGTAGESVMITSLAVGDTNCAFGGSAFTGIGGPAYACNGAEGKPGEKGKTGVSGENVNVATLIKGSEPEPTNECHNLGGAKFTNGTGTAYACNGEAASGNELKAGETESGTWGAVVGGGTSSPYVGYGPITFQRPTENSVTVAVHVIKKGGSATTECPGTPENPAAAEGNLCIYVAEESKVLIGAPYQYHIGATVLLVNTTAAEGSAVGTWAVTD